MSLHYNLQPTVESDQKIMQIVTPAVSVFLPGSGSFRPLVADLVGGSFCEVKQLDPESLSQGLSRNWNLVRVSTRKRTELSSNSP